MHESDISKTVCRVPSKSQFYVVAVYYILGFDVNPLLHGNCSNRKGLVKKIAKARIEENELKSRK